jgi:hypothetical protein
LRDVIELRLERLRDFLHGGRVREDHADESSDRAIDRRIEQRALQIAVIRCPENSVVYADVTFEHRKILDASRFDCVRSTCSIATTLPLLLERFEFSVRCIDGHERRLLSS